MPGLRYKATSTREKAGDLVPAARQVLIGPTTHVDSSTGGVVEVGHLGISVEGAKNIGCGDGSRARGVDQLIEESRCSASATSRPKSDRHERCH